MTKSPENLRYTKEHEWVSLDGNTATIGITEYAAEHLGDIVHVEFPAVGDDVDAEASVGTVESVKSVSDIFSPLSGKITEINESLAENSGSINEDAYGEGWIVKLEISNPAEFNALMTAEQYDAFLAEET